MKFALYVELIVMILIQSNFFIFFLNIFFRGKGWLEHIYLEHNVYHYLDFLIYIKEKDINNCNGIEKYVKETVSKRNIEFLPMKRALCLDEDTDNNRNKTN